MSSITDPGHSLPEAPNPDVPTSPDVVLDLLARITTIPVPATPIPWFLDVDGVLNACVGWKGKNPDAWPEYELVSADSAPGQSFPIRFAPGLVACLNLLVGGGWVEVRWLTTWESAAATHLAPAIGLDVGDRLAGEQCPVNFDAAGYVWWKAPLLTDQIEAGDFPLAIWTDDDLEMYPEVEVFLDDHPEILAICPQTDVGLTPRDIELILDRIAAVTS